MHDSRATGKRSEKSHHEIDGVVCWQDAEVTHPRPKRIERSQSDALLQIIFMRHQAALGAAARSGGIYDAGGVTAFAWDKCRFALAAEFLPTLRPCQVGVGRSFSYE